MSEEEEDDVNFKAGTEIQSTRATYTIIRLLGEGGFGAVYLVKDKAGKQHAMKVEQKTAKRRHSKLKMEIAILKLAGTGKHFTQIVDRGRKINEKDPSYFFLVMQLVGKSLSDLKGERPDKVFSYQTGMGVAKQCLESVEDLHKHGFIHRDLKPQNYACGLADQKHLIYLLDFGIARKIINNKNELKTPRVTVGFKGTVRFASLACHRNIEMGPKDDCESWFYLLIDLILIGGLTWKKCGDKNEVMRLKEEARHGDRKGLYGDLKNTDEMTKIIDYIDQLAYQDRVDYQYIYKFLEEACTNLGLNIDAPYDWEVKKKESGRDKDKVSKEKETQPTSTKNDFQQVGMAWVPEKFRGREILSVVTQCLMEEGMKEKNTLACNVVWSQNFWRKASGNADVSSCIYYISYYDLEEFKLPGIQENGIFVKNINTDTMNDALSYDKSVFPFSRDNWMRQLFTEGIARIAYDAAGNVIGIGCLSVYPSGECVISPLYAENKKTAQLLFQSILKETLEMHREKRLWRMQVRSNDQCRGSFRWIEPFLKRPPHRVHLSNLCYSLYPPRHFFNFSKVFVNSHPTNEPC